MEFEKLVALLRENGIVGAGGAGFPTYAKLDKRADTILINCAECEPLLRLHRQLMEQKAAEILEAVDLIAKTVGVQNVKVCLKAAYRKAIEALEANLAPYKNIEICKLPEIYPAGDEVVMIYEATKRVVAPGSLPITVGVTVMNVETVFNVYNALHGTPVTHKYITIAGEVKHPATYYAPIGMKYSELIALAGGETTPNPAYVMGGPMMGGLGSSNDYVTKTSNAIIVLPENHYVVQRKRTKTSIDVKRAMASCCQCSVCTDLCPRHLLGHPIQPHELMRVVSNHDTANVTPYLNSMFCCSCGLCEMYSCFQGLSPRNLLGAVKNQLRAAGVKVTPPAEAPVPSSQREFRKVPLHRLRARMDLEKYDKSAPIQDAVPDTKRVQIKLSQHVGVPASALVKVGDVVTAGQKIAEAADGKLSVCIHSSINGKVTEVTDRYIVIEK